MMTFQKKKKTPLVCHHTLLSLGSFVCFNSSVSFYFSLFLVEGCILSTSSDVFRIVFRIVFLAVTSSLYWKEEDV